jgi:hypothetical protein
LTRGDRRAATGFDLGAYAIDTKYGRRALQHVLDSIQWRMVFRGDGVEARLLALGRAILGEGEPLDTGTAMARLADCLGYMGIVNAQGQVEKKDATVKKFLNRMLGIPAAMQHLLFGYYTAVLDCIVAAARADGSYDDGVADILGQSVRVAHTRTLFTSAAGVATVHHMVQVDRGVSHAQAQAYVAAVDNDPHAIAGFYIARHELFGRRLVVCAVPRGDSNRVAAVYRPNTGRAPRDMAQGDLLAKYTPIAADAVQHAWDQMVCLCTVGCAVGPDGGPGRHQHDSWRMCSTSRRCGSACTGAGARAGWACGCRRSTSSAVGCCLCGASSRARLRGWCPARRTR